MDFFMYPIFPSFHNFDLKDLFTDVSSSWGLEVRPPVITVSLIIFKNFSHSSVKCALQGLSTNMDVDQYST